jgi:hypothetical protein
MGTLLFWPDMWLHLGLHGDEAWAGLRADALAHGAPWHFFGMNTHAGPLHQHLVAWVFRWTGPTMLPLRAVGALANGIALGSYGWLLGQQVGQRAALWTCALVASLPAVLTFGGVAIEYFALSPLLTVAAQAAWRRSKWAPYPRCWSVLAGMLLGVGTWNHLAYIAVAVGAWAAAVVGSQASRQKRRNLWAAGLGWLAVELYPLIAIGTRIKIRGGGWGAWARLMLWPRAVWDATWGSGTALQTVGVASALPVAGHLVLGGIFLLAVLGAVRHRIVHGRLPPMLAPVVAALGAYSLVTVVVVPGLGGRFVWPMLWLLPLAIVLGLAPWGRWMTHGACLALGALQVYVFVYDVARPMAYGSQVGNIYRPYNAPETSNHYLDMAPVYEALTHLGAHHVIGQNFIGWPLAFLDLPHQRLTVGYIDDTEYFAPKAVPRPGDFIVTYAHGVRTLSPEHLSNTYRVLTLPQFVISRQR